MKDVYKKILVPVDDSNQAMNALHEAIAVAKRNEAELFILNVKDETSYILCPLLHDICKTNFYKVDYRNAKNARGEWEKVPYYAIEDTIPYGHGEKSVMMLTEYIKLTNEEKYSIRWHMGFTEPKEVYNTLGQAFKKFPLALILHEADLEATYFYNI